MKFYNEESLELTLHQERVLESHLEELEELGYKNATLIDSLDDESVVLVAWHRYNGNKVIKI